MKFGMIPEIIGRVPMVVSLDQLDREALIRILKEPKNSIIKQYQKLFEMDGVELSFADDAIEEDGRQDPGEKDRSQRPPGHHGERQCWISCTTCPPMRMWRAA